MKSLVIYFSRADENYFGGAMRTFEKGNTEVIAEFIQELTGADLFKVERKTDYSKDYMTCIKEAQEEQRKGEKPELKKYLDNIDDYDLIYIGGPIYWGTLPQPMFTQLEKLGWAGKTVKPFSTHEGSGLGNVVNDLKKICVGATVKAGLAIVGSSVRNAKESVRRWVHE